MALKKRIDIVLATYNGERYLKEQLDSLLKTDNINFIKKLIVSDDSSSDDTLKIVEEYSSLVETHIVRNINRAGPVGNFFNGLQYSESDYVMFCDQDDVWDDDKLSTFMLEAVSLKANKPGAVYSDLRLVNSQLNQLGVNFFENERIPADWGFNFQNLLLQNVSPGCAMLINRCCVEKLLISYNSNILMHDWWALLFASFYNNVRLISKPTLSYRQHENNAVGASSKKSWLDIFHVINKSYENLFKSITQAQTFIGYVGLPNSNDIKIKNILLYDGTFHNSINLVLTPTKLKSTFIRDVLTRVLILFNVIKAG